MGFGVGSGSAANGVSAAAIGPHFSASFVETLTNPYAERRAFFFSVRTGGILEFARPSNFVEGEEELKCNVHAIDRKMLLPGVISGAIGLAWCGFNVSLHHVLDNNHFDMFMIRC
jgi:hypothetical protein